MHRIKKQRNNKLLWYNSNKIELEMSADHNQVAFTSKQQNTTKKIQNLL
jgi:hypothetical protein